jgi:signal transduction histidine kinase
MQLAAQRMQMLIDDLLAYSRTGKSESKLVKTDLKQIISEIKNDLQEELDVRNAIIDEKGDCSFPMIPFQFRQLLQNLISNALKFSKPGQSPYITIVTKPGKGSDFKNETFKPEAK